MAKRLSPRNSEVNALEQRGYLIGKKIGQGSYATVHLAEYIDGASMKKMRLACKIFDKEKAPDDFLDKFFPRELEILTKIENPHIIQLIREEQFWCTAFCNAVRVSSSSEHRPADSRTGHHSQTYAREDAGPRVGESKEG
ncbi:Testis-specific serine/threonine-protein kinase 6 [Cyphomyrmex costatus]|uniref:Testis-specific serine/threonine-protein kinase 6 n=1 Tax=Cyphomyrmex costatus TaxID=456900 RepID=A0A195CUW2_9HYME|nr:Testis-specific serine/threonine-protein kinase 6 [Cyphomyrmex costatus]